MANHKLPTPAVKEPEGSPEFRLMVKILSGGMQEEHLCATVPGEPICRQGRKLLQRLVTAQKSGMGSKQYQKAAEEFLSHFEGERVLSALGEDNAPAKYER